MDRKTIEVTLNTYIKKINAVVKPLRRGYRVERY